jgi:hypothetical protein
MPYGLTVRRFAAPMLIALLAVAWLSLAEPAQAHRFHGEDARIGAEGVVLDTAQRLDRSDPSSATDRVATGKLGECRRVSAHFYRCDARYEVRTYSLTEATKRRTCTQTVGVTVSHRGYGRTRARSLDDLTCRDE